MKNRLKLFLFLSAFTASFMDMSGQNTLPSAVVTSPHNNAYFEQGTDVNIRVYSSDLGGTYTGGSITKVEFYKDDTKLGESSEASSNTYSYLWLDVPAGNYRITAKATDNEGAVFASAGVLITVGSNSSKSIGLSAGKGKYLANIIPNSVRPDYNVYWNGITSENACKWKSVENTRDVMNWTSADVAYNHAKNYNMSFRYHVLAWGSQYPSWIETLNPADFQAEMEEYIAAVADRYPLIDQIDVLNENMYINSWDKKEHAAGTPFFRAGLGGPGETGYDWVIWLFEKTRLYFPNAKLIMNDFELVTNSDGLNEMLDVIKVLRDRGLIDGIGAQAHTFNMDGISGVALGNALNRMANSGLPIYITELDLKGNSTEAGQLYNYEKSFPILWNHPAVAGITLWGYVEGQTWKEGTGLLNSDGSERSAMTWMKSFMAGLPDVGYPFDANGQNIDTTNIIINGEFDTNTSPWKIDNYNGGQGTIAITTDANMSGSDALQVCTTAPGTEGWHIQVSQDAPFVAGKNYELSFMAKADASISIAVTMQQAGDPYAQYMEEELNLSNSNQNFLFQFKPSQTDVTNKLKFFVGLTTNCINIDNVVFREVEATSVKDLEDIQLISVYPNPVTSGKLIVENNSSERLKKIEIIDLQGKIIQTINLDDSRAEIDVSDLKKGIYFLRIQFEKSLLSRRFVVL